MTFKPVTEIMQDRQTRLMNCQEKSWPWNAPSWYWPFSFGLHEWRTADTSHEWLRNGSARSFDDLVGFNCELQFIEIRFCLSNQLIQWIMKFAQWKHFHFCLTFYCINLWIFCRFTSWIAIYAVNMKHQTPSLITQSLSSLWTTIFNHNWSVEMLPKVCADEQ